MKIEIYSRLKSLVLLRFFLYLFSLLCPKLAPHIPKSSTWISILFGFLGGMEYFLGDNILKSLLSLLSSPQGSGPLE